MSYAASFRHQFHCFYFCSFDKPGSLSAVGTLHLSSSSCFGRPFLPDCRHTLPFGLFITSLLDADALIFCMPSFMFAFVWMPDWIQMDTCPTHTSSIFDLVYVLCSAALSDWSFFLFPLPNRLHQFLLLPTTWSSAAVSQHLVPFSHHLFSILQHSSSLFSHPAHLDLYVPSDHAYHRFISLFDTYWNKMTLVPFCQSASWGNSKWVHASLSWMSNCTTGWSNSSGCVFWASYLCNVESDWMPEHLGKGT